MELWQRFLQRLLSTFCSHDGNITGGILDNRIEGGAQQIPSPASLTTPAEQNQVCGFLSGSGQDLVSRIAAGLHRQGQTALLVPVALNSVALGRMLSSAWATLFRPAWTPLRRGLAVAGASLFFASDAMLAWDRFVTPSPSADLRVIVTYHLGQVALAASIAL